MAVPNRQIGWSTESNLLWEANKQLEKLICQFCSVDFGATKAYGAFQDNSTQTTDGNENLAVKLDTTDVSSGITVQNDTFGNPTKIVVSNSGVYDFQFSAQLRKTQGGSAQQIYIWLRVDGTDVPDSNTQLTLANNGHLLVAAWNFFVQANAGSYIQLMWRATDEHVQLVYDDPIPGTIPKIPSVIVTVNKIN